MSNYKQHSALSVIHDALTSLHSAVHGHKFRATVIIHELQGGWYCVGVARQHIRFQLCGADSVIRLVGETIVTPDLLDLLAMSNPAAASYNKGRNVLVQVLSDPRGGLLDYLCCDPLEAILKLGRAIFAVRCHPLRPGWLYSLDTSWNRIALLYLILHTRKSTHHLAALSFLSVDYNQALIDITAGDAADVFKKSQRLVRRIKQSEQINNIWSRKSVVARAVIPSS